jgi:hypothetical protein
MVPLRQSNILLLNRNEQLTTQLTDEQWCHIEAILDIIITQIEYEELNVCRKSRRNHRE